jgi:antitoxin YefM
MSTVYRVKASEIDGAFLEKIKATFGNKEIEIVVSELNQDETEYLFKSEANKNRLLTAVENIKAQKNLVEVNLEDLQ